MGKYDPNASVTDVDVKTGPDLPLIGQNHVAEVTLEDGRTGTGASSDRNTAVREATKHARGKYSWE